MCCFVSDARNGFMYDVTGAPRLLSTYPYLSATSCAALGDHLVCIYPMLSHLDAFCSCMWRAKKAWKSTLSAMRSAAAVRHRPHKTLPWWAMSALLGLCTHSIDNSFTEDRSGVLIDVSDTSVVILCRDQAIKTSENCYSVHALTATPSDTLAQNVYTCVAFPPPLRAPRCSCELPSLPTQIRPCITRSRTLHSAARLIVTSASARGPLPAALQVLRPPALPKRTQGLAMGARIMSPSPSQQEMARLQEQLQDTSKQLGDLSKSTLAAPCLCSPMPAGMSPVDWGRVGMYYRNSALTLGQTMHRMLPPELIVRATRFHAPAK